MTYQLIKILGEVVAETKDRQFTFDELLEYEKKYDIFLLRNKVGCG